MPDRGDSNRGRSNHERYCNGATHADAGRRSHQDPAWHCQAGAVANDEMIEVPGLGERGPRMLSRQALAAVIEPRIEELFGLIQNAVRGSGYEGVLGSGVVL